MSLRGPRDSADWALLGAMLLLVVVSIALTLVRLIEYQDRIPDVGVMNNVWAATITATVGCIVWYVHRA